ncbi:MAG: DUF4112 domain-containing protein [Phenylobacterium sp.]|uniref:DUF4112 domain-containing protein n=1 Tax=Phenylobacterium sp. TaxID=1871053 RepID=UPI002717DBEA|nr:DUF4112 domain-containing protein [Phenylobacterium sp.]MDO8408947.1 DUF4112 domain-containing protein [Phenylobacterium sp.]
MATTQDKAHRAWRAAERIKRLSDRLVGVGPIGLGLDGILAWVPVAGTVYSVGAGALLVVAGFRGGVSVITLGRMAAYLFVDTASSTVPFIGWTVDTLFPGHLMAANALQKDIEARHGPSVLPASWDRKRKARPGRRGVKI